MHAYGRPETPMRYPNHERSYSTFGDNAALADQCRVELDGFYRESFQLDPTVQHRLFQMVLEYLKILRNTFKLKETTNYNRAPSVAPSQCSFEHLRNRQSELLHSEYRRAQSFSHANGSVYGGHRAESVYGEQLAKPQFAQTISNPHFSVSPNQSIPHLTQTVPPQTPMHQTTPIHQATPIRPTPVSVHQTPSIHNHQNHSLHQNSLLQQQQSQVQTPFSSGHGLNQPRGPGSVLQNQSANIAEPVSQSFDSRPDLLKRKSIVRAAWAESENQPWRNEAGKNEHLQRQGSGNGLNSIKGKRHSGSSMKDLLNHSPTEGLKGEKKKGTPEILKANPIYSLKEHLKNSNKTVLELFDEFKIDNFVTVKSLMNTLLRLNVDTNDIRCRDIIRLYVKKKGVEKLNLLEWECLCNDLLGIAHIQKVNARRAGCANSCQNLAQSDKDLLRTITETLLNAQPSLSNLFKKLCVSGGRRMSVDDMHKGIKKFNLHVNLEDLKEIIIPFDKTKGGLSRAEFIRFINAGKAV